MISSFSVHRPRHLVLYRRGGRGTRPVLGSSGRGRDEVGTRDEVGRFCGCNDNRKARNESGEDVVTSADSFGFGDCLAKTVTGWPCSQASIDEHQLCRYHRKLKLRLSVPCQHEPHANSKGVTRCPLTGRRRGPTPPRGARHRARRPCSGRQEVACGSRAAAT